MPLLPSLLAPRPAPAAHTHPSEPRSDVRSDSRRSSVISVDDSICSDDLMMESRPHTPFEEAMRHARPMMSGALLPATQQGATGLTETVLNAARAHSLDVAAHKTEPGDASLVGLESRLLTPWPVRPLSLLEAYPPGSEPATVSCRMAPLSASVMSHAPMSMFGFLPRVTVAPMDWSQSSSESATPMQPHSPTTPTGRPGDDSDKFGAPAAK